MCLHTHKHTHTPNGLFVQPETRWFFDHDGRLQGFLGHTEHTHTHSHTQTQTPLIILRDIHTHAQLYHGYIIYKETFARACVHNHTNEYALRLGWYMITYFPWFACGCEVHTDTQAQRKIARDYWTLSVVVRWVDGLSLSLSCSVFLWVRIRTRCCYNDVHSIVCAPHTYFITTNRRRCCCRRRRREGGFLLFLRSQWLMGWYMFFYVSCFFWFVVQWRQARSYVQMSLRGRDKRIIIIRNR